MKTITLNRIPLLLLLAIGLFASCEKNDDVSISTKEEMVEVGGYQLYTRTSGEKEPKIVLISGVGGSTHDWRSMEDDFSEVATVINYDREGLGKSPWQKRAKDSETVAKELHALLAAKNVAPPYILVGHSLGGFYARAFTNLYKNEVEGIILVDPTPENLIDSLIAMLPLEEQPGAREALRKAEEESIKQLPEGGIKEEVKAINTLYQQARNMTLTTDAPIAIISSMRLEKGDAQISKETAKKQRDQLLAQISTGPNKHYTTTKAGHFVQKDQPALVMEAVNWVMMNIQ